MPFHPLSSSRRPAGRPVFTLGFILALSAFFTGCAPRRYERAADREVYRIIQQAEQTVFGATNTFTIATPYSARDPKEIPAAEIIENRSQTNRRVLRLEDALQLGIQHSREYQTQKERLYLSALSLTGSRYEFSPQFFAESEGTLAGTTGGPDTGSLKTQIGVSQLLRTGGRLSVSLANDLLRWFTGWSPSGGNNTRDTAVNVLSVNLSQPILRGFGRMNPQVEALTQSERNVIYAVRTFSQYQRQFAVDIVNAYFGLLRQKDTVRNNYTNYLRRADFTVYNEARAVDRASRLQVDEARSQELNARISYVNSLAAYLNAAAAFKLRLGLPQSEEVFFDDTDLRDLAKAGLLPVEIDRHAAFRLSTAKHLDILTAIDRFEDTKRKLRLAADQLKPGLIFNGGASVQSEEPYDYANFDLDRVRYDAGLKLDLPLDRLRERNNYRAARVDFEAEIRSLANTLDTFRRDIDDGLRNLEQQRLNLLSRQEALAVATSREENSRLSFEAGRATIRDVRDSQDALIEAQNEVTFTLVNYLQARLFLLLDMGVLKTDETAFWLKDPLQDVVTPEMRGPSPLQMPRDTLIPPNQFIEPPQ
ncbi:MAG: TolC family protein [Verrucomicrobiales bacterium]|nr:TolC family protein [Verrucomicrobiales bacterium]